MFKKYRMYCYIKKCGKVSQEELIGKFKISEQYLVDLTGVNHEGTELANWAGFIELRAEGHEYIAKIRREALFAGLTVVLTVILTALIS